MTRLYVVRHGESPSNVLGVITGRSEEGLTDEGMRQMERVREKLAGEEFAAVYASPVKRVMLSAQIVIPEAEPIYDQRLVERDVGDLRDMKAEELWRKPLWDSLVATRTEDGAETLAAGLARVKEFLDEVRERYPERQVLLVTHSFVSRCIWMLVTGVGTAEESYVFQHPHDEVKIYEY